MLALEPITLHRFVVSDATLFAELQTQARAEGGLMAFRFQHGLVESVPSEGLPQHLQRSLDEDESRAVHVIAPTRSVQGERALFEQLGTARWDRIRLYGVGSDAAEVHASLAAPEWELLCAWFLNGLGEVPPVAAEADTQRSHAAAFLAWHQAVVDGGGEQELLDLAEDYLDSLDVEADEDEVQQPTLLPGWQVVTAVKPGPAVNAERWSLQGGDLLLRASTRSDDASPTLRWDGFQIGDHEVSVQVWDASEPGASLKVEVVAPDALWLWHLHSLTFRSEQGEQITRLGAMQWYRDEAGTIKALGFLEDADATLLEHLRAGGVLPELVVSSIVLSRARESLPPAAPSTREDDTLLSWTNGDGDEAAKRMEARMHIPRDAAQPVRLSVQLEAGGHAGPALLRLFDAELRPVLYDPVALQLSTNGPQGSHGVALLKATDSHLRSELRRVALVQIIFERLAGASEDEDG